MDIVVVYVCSNAAKVFVMVEKIRKFAAVVSVVVNLKVVGSWWRHRGN
jgi:hypothetical protein